MINENDFQVKVRTFWNPILAISFSTTVFVSMDTKAMRILTHRIHQFGQMDRQHLPQVHGIEWSINKLGFRDQQIHNIQ